MYIYIYILLENKLKTKIKLLTKNPVLTEEIWIFAFLVSFSFAR